MILDSSAVIAILLEEAGFEPLLAKADSAEQLAIGTPTLLEVRISLARKSASNASARLVDFLTDGEVRITPFTADHLEVAFQAFERYGKGRHPAKLNFGDCISYAVALVSGQPLLYKGDDFAKTDIEAA